MYSYNWLKKFKLIVLSQIFKQTTKYNKYNKVLCSVCWVVVTELKDNIFSMFMSLKREKERNFIRKYWQETINMYVNCVAPRTYFDILRSAFTDILSSAVTSRTSQSHISSRTSCTKTGKTLTWKWCFYTGTLPPSHFNCTFTVRFIN